MTAQRVQLPDGRWHLQHGPMDIIIGGSGSPTALALAHERAWKRFAMLLDGLVQELPLLRQPVRGNVCPLRGPVARRMWEACMPYQSTFITPMAAVAGAVAQELVACYAASGVQRAWVNNGGDIALYLAASQSVRVGICADVTHLRVDGAHGELLTQGQFEVHSAQPVRGVATSGWRGRSFSLGIADSVTVLAATAAQADAAATVIANAVNAQDRRIVRRPAGELKDDSDLGDIAVTVDVPHLEPDVVQRALHAGLLRAQALQAEGLIWSAALVCQNQTLRVNALEKPVQRNACFAYLAPSASALTPALSQREREPRQTSLQPLQGAMEPRQKSLQSQQGAMEPRQKSLQSQQGAMEPRQKSLQSQQGAREPRQHISGSLSRAAGEGWGEGA